MKIPAGTVTLTSALLLTAISVFAAPEPQTKNKPARHLRILAVGDSPPFLQEVRDGVRYELEPPPGSLPPREVLAGFGKTSGKSLPLHLGRISPQAEVPEGTGQLELRTVNEAAQATPWLRVNRPETGDFLILLWRQPREKDWTKIANLIIPDGPLGTPAGTVRVVNLFPQAVRIKWGDEALLLVPRSTFLRQIKPGAEIPFQVIANDSEGRLKTYYSTNVTQNPGERGIITIYQADGESPRRPLKVAMLREPVTPESTGEQLPATTPPPDHTNGQ